MAGKRRGSRVPVKRPSGSAVVQQAVGQLPSSYGLFMEELKARIRAARVKAVLAANEELIQLYWDIGKAIVERQEAEGWGKAIVDRLARDLQGAFPGMTGFSPSNVWRMRAFYLAWTEEVLAQAVRESGSPILAQVARVLDGCHLPQAVAQIPWFHSVILLEKLKSPAIRLWYARTAMEDGWSRAVLVHQIETGLHERQGKAVTNFGHALPPPQSDLAQQVIKDPYVFDFLSLSDDVAERELQRGLVDHALQALS